MNSQISVIDLQFPCMVRGHTFHDFNLLKSTETCFYGLAYSLSWIVFYVHVVGPRLSEWGCVQEAHDLLVVVPSDLVSAAFLIFLDWGRMGKGVPSSWPYPPRVEI